MVAEKIRRREGGASSSGDEFQARNFAGIVGDRPVISPEFENIGLVGRAFGDSGDFSH